MSDHSARSCEGSSTDGKSLGTSNSGVRPVRPASKLAPGSKLVHAPPRPPAVSARPVVPAIRKRTTDESVTQASPRAAVPLPGVTAPHPVSLPRPAAVRSEAAPPAVAMRPPVPVIPKRLSEECATLPSSGATGPLPGATARRTAVMPKPAAVKPAAGPPAALPRPPAVRPGAESPAALTQPAAITPGKAPPCESAQPPVVHTGNSKLPSSKRPGAVAHATPTLGLRAVSADLAVTAEKAPDTASRTQTQDDHVLPGAGTLSARVSAENSQQSSSGSSSNRAPQSASVHDIQTVRSTSQSESSSLGGSHPRRASQHEAPTYPHTEASNQGHDDQHKLQATPQALGSSGHHEPSAAAVAPSTAESLTAATEGVPEGAPVQNVDTYGGPDSSSQLDCATVPTPEAVAAQHSPEVPACWSASASGEAPAPDPSEHMSENEYVCHV